MINNAMVTCRDVVASACFLVKGSSLQKQQKEKVFQVAISGE